VYAEYDSGQFERVALLATDDRTWEAIDLSRGGEPVGRVFQERGCYRTEHFDCDGVVPGFALSTFDQAKNYFEEYLFAVELGSPSRL
jgi:hypothetical protein